jgi:CubicO group peptidase (beta-lactamase class C family)
VLYDWEKVTGLIAAQKPWWEPGTKPSYHMITFGYLTGELVRRVTGKSIGTFFREEIAHPLNIDFHIGISEEVYSRVADIITPPYKKLYPPWALLFMSFFRTAKKIMFNPDLSSVNFNGQKWRSAEIPSSNGHGNGRSIARVGAILANGGILDGKRILSHITVENAIEEQISGRDKIMFNTPMSYGLGFGLSNKEILKGNKGFYWSGAGGSVCIMDLEKKLSIGYAMNKMSTKIKDFRVLDLVYEVWDIVNSEF